MGYIWQNLWDILGLYYRLYFGIYFAKIMGYNKKIRDFFCKTLGYTGPLDILRKN